MKRKVIAILMLLVLVFTLTGCDSVYFEPGSVTKENLEEMAALAPVKVNNGSRYNANVEVTDDDIYVPENNVSEEVYELPSISNYPLDIKGDGEIDVEIFVPYEDNSSKVREYIVYIAKAFNSEDFGGFRVNGKTVSVSVRSLEANLAEEYILNGTYCPDGYIAQNELYGIWMKENGIEVSMVHNRTARNTMGIVIRETEYKKLAEKYGEVTIATIVKAINDGELSIGYLNPTNNPTGLNFVVSMLSYFDASNPMSMEATTDFANFQNAVTSVFYSTSQMKSAVEAGAIDAFVMEHQAFEMDESFETRFVFTPFGVRHDNPLYAVGNVTDEELQVLELFGNFFEDSEVIHQSTDGMFGFKLYGDDYVSSVGEYSGNMLSEILSFWKTEKSSGKQIAVIFIADISGSMSGKKLSALKDSLRNAKNYISEQHKVGLMSYHSYVFLDMDLGEFVPMQRAKYDDVIEHWRANGGTATNDALLAALKILHEECKVNPDVKPIIILLSDGYTGNGYSFNSVREVIDVYDIPIYTIGYEADVEELERIAKINGGAFINATSDDVGYILKTLFNAEF